MFLIFFKTSCFQLVSMGFDPEMVKKALVKLNGNIQQASEELLQNGGVIFGNVDLSSFLSGASSSGTSGKTKISHLRDRYSLSQTDLQVVGH